MKTLILALLLTSACAANAQYYLTHHIYNNSLWRIVVNDTNYIRFNSDSLTWHRVYKTGSVIVGVSDTIKTYYIHDGDFRFVDVSKDYIQEFCNFQCMNAYRIDRFFSENPYAGFEKDPANFEKYYVPPKAERGEGDEE